MSISLLNEIINCVQRKNQDMYTESCWKMCLITVYWLWIIRSLEIHYPWSILEITLSAPPDDSTDIYLLIKGCQSPKPIKVFKKSLKEYTCEVVLLSLMNNSVPYIFSPMFWTFKQSPVFDNGRQGWTIGLVLWPEASNSITSTECPVHSKWSLFHYSPSVQVIGFNVI